MNKLVLAALAALILAGCQNGSDPSKVDSLLGGNNGNKNDVTQSPIFQPLSNITVQAGSAMPQVTPQVSDPNLLPLTYSCVYDLAVDGIVSPTASGCDSLLNADGSSADFNKGTGAFNWTPSLSMMGKQFEFKITAADALASASQIFVVSVIAPAPDTSTSTLAVNSSTLISGHQMTVTLQGKDKSGTNLTYGGSTIVFSTTGGTSTGTWSSTTDNGDGTYTATFTGVTSGSATTIRATIQNAFVTTTLPTVTVQTGPISVSGSQVSLSSASVASGSSVTITLTAKDVNGNRVTSGGATISFGRSGGTSTGTISSVTDNGDGTYSATFTGIGAGTATSILGFISGVQLTSSSANLTVLPGPMSLSTSTVTLSNSVVASGSAINVTLTSRDANSNQLTVGGLAASFVLSGVGTSTGNFAAVVDRGDGTYTTTFTGVTAGTAVSIVGSLSGSSLTSSAPSITVSAGAASPANSILTVGASTLISGQSTTLTLTAKDSNGNTIVAGGSTVAFTYSGGASTGTISSVTDNGNGTYTATFTAVLSGTATTIHATIGGVAVTTTLPTISVQPGAISVAQSNITLSAATVASGSTMTMTMHAKDAAGNALSSGGSTVVFTRSGGTSTGNISGTTDNANGTYTGTFTGVVAGTATSIGATIGGVAITTTLPTLQVTVGSVDLAHSTITVSASTVASGSAVTLTLHAKDASGNSFTSGGLTVAFANTGGTSTGTIGGTTDNGDGTYSATFTGAVAGTATSITATIGGSAVTSTLPTVQVTFGTIAVSQSTITVSSASVVSGSAVTLTLHAKDSSGNSITSGGATVVFTQSGGTSTGTIGSTTDNSDGTYTASFTGVLAGTARGIGATIGGATVTTTLPTVTVTAGAISAAQSYITASLTSIVSGGTATVTLHAKDAAGNLISSGGATVVFNRSSGTSSGVFSSTTDNTNGTYAATFQGVSGGTPAVIGATINGTAVTSTLPSIQVTAGPASLSQSVISVSASTVASGSAVTLILQAKDASGNNHTSGGLTVAFARTGGTSTGTIGSTTDNGDGTYSATFTGVVAGTATSITATIGGSAVTSASPTVQVLVGPIAASQSTITVSSAGVVSGNTVTLTLHAKDASGNVITTGGATVVFTQSGGTSTGTIGSTTDNGDGTYTASFTGVLAGTARSIGATIGGATVTTTLPTVTVTAGAISIAQSYVTLSASSVASGLTMTMTLHAKDAAGNALSSGGSSVAFTRSGGTSTGNISTATDNTDGTYSGTFTGVVAGTATSIGATIGGVAISTTLPTVQVTVGSVDLAHSTVSVSASSVASGNAVTLTLQAKDVNSNSLSSGGLGVIFNRSGGTSTGNISSTTDNSNGTYSATFTGVVMGTPTSIIATIGGLPVTSTSPTVQVTFGAVSLANTTITRASATVTSGLSTAVTLTAKDAAGNQAPSGGLVVVFSNTGGTSTGSFSSLVDNGDGTYSSNFTGLLAGTPTSMSATVGGSAVTNTLPTVQVLPGAISTANSVITVGTSVIASGSNTTLTLQAVDSHGNNLTSGGATVVFSQSGGTSTGTISATTDNANGTYTAMFSALTAGSASTITATIGSSPVTSVPAPQITVVAGLPASLSFSVQPTTSTSPTNVFPTQPVVQVLDSNNNVVTTGSGSTTQIALTLTVVSGAGTLGGTATMNAVSGVANFSGKGLYISSTGTYKLTATASALSLTTVSSTITITATTPTIAATKPLMIAHNASAVINTTVTNKYATPSGSGTAASTTGIVNPVQSVITASGSAGSIPTTSSYSPLDMTDWTGVGWSISVTGANGSTCSSLAPFAAVSCYVNGMTLAFSDILNATTTAPNNFFQINDGYLNSNKLTVTKYTITQVSDFSTSSGDDNASWASANIAYISPYFYNSKVYFTAPLDSYGSGFRNMGLVSMDSSGTFKFEAKTSGFSASGGYGNDDRISQIIAFNGALYFKAASTADTASATTAAGNPRLFKFIPGANSSTTGTLTQVSTTATCDVPFAILPGATSAQDRLYFVAQNGSGVCKLHYIDTSDAIKQVSDIQGSATTDAITSLIYFNSAIWFEAKCNNAYTNTCTTGNYEFYKIDSSGNITLVLKSPNSTSAVSAWGSGNPGYSGIIFNGKLYWNGYSITTANAITNIGGPKYQLTIFNNELYGAYKNGCCSPNYKLIKVDTSGNINLVSNISGYNNVNDYVKVLGVTQTSGGADNELYFSASAGGLFTKVFKVDTTNKVYQVSNVRSGNADVMSPFSDQIYQWFGYSMPTGASGAGELYYMGYNSAGHQKLMKISQDP